jgi:serine/threonine protein kinase/tetratricopeptide (TPR) repeat protein
MKQQQAACSAPESAVGPLTLDPIPRSVELDDPRVMQAVEEYLAALEAGHPLDRQEFQERHPEIAAAVARCLDGLQFLRAAAPHLRESAARHEAAGSGTAAAILPEGPLGDFRLVREVGRGGMGVVYEAVQISLGRQVALKALPFAAALDAKQLQRFQNEAQAAAHLHHPHIVPVYTVGCERGVYYYAMQFIEGQTLAALIQELRRQATVNAGAPPTGAGPAAALAVELVSGRWASPDQRPAAAEPPGAELAGALPPGPTAAAATTQPAAVLSTERSIVSREFFRTVAQLGVQAAEALEHAHSLGVVHRDIKPANLLVDRHGQMWITDFGLAQCQGQTGLTLTGDRVGTARYMSPEQATGQRALVDYRTDMYSLGVTLYELLTLEPACPGHDWAEVQLQIIRDEPRPPRHWNPALPKDLETIVLKAMTREPEHRYATAQEFADDLRRFLEDQPVHARRPTPMQRATKWARRHRSVVVAALGLLVMAVVALAVSTALIVGERNEVSRQRDEAETRRRQARRAVDTMYTRVAQEWLAYQPHLEEVQLEFLEEALQFYLAFASEQATDPEVRQQTGAALYRVGTICRMLKRARPAEEAFRKAIALQQQLTAELPNEPAFRRDLAGSHADLAVLLLDANRLPEAENACRQAISLLGVLTTDLPAMVDYQRDLARSYNILGSVLRANNRRGEAESAFRATIALCEALVADCDKVPDYRCNLAVGLTNLGGLLQTTAGWPEAEKGYRRAIILLEALAAEFPKVPIYRGHLAGLSNHLAVLLVNTRRGPEAEKVLQRAIDLLNGLATDFPKVPDYRRDLAGSHMNLGNLLEKTGQLPQAEETCRWAIDLLDQLAAEFPTVPDYRWNLAGSHFTRGNVLKALGRLPEAQKSYEQAIVLVKTLEVDFSRVPSYQSQLAVTHDHLALLSRDQGELAEARQHLEQALVHYRAIQATSPEHPTYRPLLRNHYEILAETLLRLGEYIEAAKAATELPQLLPADWEGSYGAATYLARCVPLAEKDARLPPEKRRTLALGYVDQVRELLRGAMQHSADKPEAQNSLAWFLATCPEPRFRDASRAVELAKQAVARAPQEGNYWNTLGVAQFRAGDWNAALLALKKSMALRQGGDSADWFFLAMAHWQQDDKEQARKWYDLAVQWMEQHQPQDQDLLRFRAEAAAQLGLPDPPTPKGKERPP